MVMTDLLKPNSESTHSSTDCWPSSALASAFMCRIRNVRGKASSKKRNQLLVSKLWTKEIFLGRSYKLDLKSLKIS